MRELSIIGRDAPAIVQMNAVRVYAAHGGQLTIRRAEALSVSANKSSGGVVSMPSQLL
jgi:hypothetical protein